MVSNPKNLLKSVRDSMLQMFRTDSVARNGKKTVFYKDVQLRHSTVGQNQDVSTGPLARQFARSLALLAHLLAPHCLLCLHALLRLFACLLAYSLTREPVGKWIVRCLRRTWFCPIFHRSSVSELQIKELMKNTNPIYIYIYFYISINRDLRCCLINWI